MELVFLSLAQTFKTCLQLLFFCTETVKARKYYLLFARNIAKRFLNQTIFLQQFTTGPAMSIMAWHSTWATSLRSLKRAARGGEVYAVESRERLEYSRRTTSTSKMSSRRIQSCRNARKFSENGRKYGRSYLW